MYMSCNNVDNKLQQLSSELESEEVEMTLKHPITCYCVLLNTTKSLQNKTNF